MTNLLACPLKLTSKINISKALLEHIQSYLDHHLSHAEALKPDLNKIQSLRNSIHENLSIHQSSLNSLISYHAHLTYLLSKFPVDIGIEFDYSIIFVTPSTMASLLPGDLPSCAPIKLPNLQFERACVLFNIAAMSMSLAISQPRITTDQLKLSIGFFRQAAGCFGFLRDFVVKKIELPPGAPIPPSPDFSEASLTALEYLSLAQSQECVWQQAAMDNKSNGVISKIAQETSKLYELSLNSMNNARGNGPDWIGFSFPEDWIKFVKLKVAHFLSVAQFRQSCNDSAKSEYGIEVARLEVAFSTLKKAVSSIKSNSSPVLEHVICDAKDLFSKLKDIRQTSHRDNDLIYHKDVPNESQLSPILPTSMAKPILPPTIQEPLKFLTENGFGKKLFEFIPPYYVFRTKGIYEDRKRDHVKSAIQDMAEGLDTQMIDALRLMNLPGSLEALERPINLPPSLIRSSEDLRQKNAPKLLLSMLHNVAQASQINHRTLKHITTLLDEEEEQDDHLRKKFGTHLWNLPISAEENKSLRQQELQLKQTFERATQTDHAVQMKYEAQIKRIELLCQDEDSIRKAIPLPRSTDLHSYNMDSSKTEYTLTAPRKLRNLLDELEDIRKNRKTIVDSALHFSSRDELNQSILNQMIGDKAELENEGNEIKIERVIEKELTKYLQYENQLKDNQSKQEQLIEEVKEANKLFLDSRTRDPITEAREKLFQNLEMAYHEYHTIVTNLEEGSRFHKEFNKYLAQLKENVERFTIYRRQQAKLLEDQLTQQLSLSRLKLEEDLCSTTTGALDDSTKIKNSPKGIVGKGKTKTHTSFPNDDIQPGLYDPNKHGPATFFDG
ncbi:hypothetical protein O181_024072 [Austropuccinia psidii MF-1]|uniref:BRO1 domain-containing protein n=1 Tax=Austropuccinia psidii MF-1 TaxID=1389203 RepID=A0A9Q3CIK1_9BASI|nr:hypothetical protein [Austropuccinia psidii MF-1]